MNHKIKSLHQRALKLAQSYHQVQGELLDVLMEMDELKGFRDLGFTSLHAYAVSELKLSEDIAYTLIRLARKSREIPELKEKLQSQEIRLSQARVIAPVLTRENQTEWLEKAAQLSKRELEKEVFSQFPEERVKERIKPVGGTRLELKLGISEELEKELKRVQDLLSQKTGKPVTLEETLKALAGEFLKKNDPVQKAERVQKKTTGPGTTTEISAPEPSRPHVPIPSASCSGTLHRSDSLLGLLPSKRRRVPIPAALKHQVNLRDRNQCTERDQQSGARCQHRRWLDIHHITPVARGGENTLENLTTLCSAHHRIHHSVAID